MTKPEMKEITGSSNIAAIGYANEVLFIRFTDGAEYAFKNVPADIHTALLAAGSAGKYFHAQIKGKFDSEKLTSSTVETNDPNAPAHEAEIAKSPEVLAGQQSTGAPGPIVDDAGNPHPMTAGEGNAAGPDTTAATDGQATDADGSAEKNRDEADHIADHAVSGGAPAADEATKEQAA